MSAYQEIEIVGNLGGDPEMKYSSGGKAYTNFSVAVTETWTGKDGQKQEDTTWFRCVCFERKAELAAEYLKKGQQVMLKGKIKASAWIDKNDGTAHASLELRVEKLIFLNNGERRTGGSSGHATAPAEAEDDGVPF